MDRSFFDKICDRRGSGSIKYGKPPAGDPEKVVPMWVADMDFRSAPSIREALEKTVDHGIFGYTDRGDAYKAAVTGWYERRMGWTIDPEWIIPVQGVIFAAATAIRALTEKGDGVMICQPVYYPFANIVKDNGRKLVVNELVLKDGKYEIDFDDFEKKAEEAKAFLFCSPHNPCGRVWTKEELERIAKICEDKGLYIISDEIHSDFVYPGHTHTPVMTLSEETAPRTVTCVSPTKTFNIAGIEAANIITSNEDIRRRLTREAFSAGSFGQNLFGSAATMAAYTGGEEWLDTLLEYLQMNIGHVRSFAESTPKIDLIEPEGTYLLWLDCRKTGLDGRQLQKFFLEEADVWLHDGSVFGKGGEGFMRMNVACPEKVLTEVLDMMRKAVV